MSDNVAGKPIVITGASSGMGRCRSPLPFAINEPDDVAINEILFRPTTQEL
jgi:NADP-dependent 3-hydroxy acid dehydrogenase YdfG